MFATQRKPRPRDLRRFPKLSFPAMWPKRQDGLCRCGCGQKLSGRRTSWATKECERKAVQAFSIAKGDIGAIRSALLKRDHGVCALCGMDTEEARAECRQWIFREEFPSDETYAAAIAASNAMRAKFMLLRFPMPEGGGSWWNADHILPLEEGGQNNLENLRTLCLRCHSRVTAEHAARRAHRRRLHGLGQSCPNP